MATETVRVDVGGAELACLVDGPPEGPLVLCAHGFPDCARSFRLQVAPLTARGFRVVRPWLRGYAPSSLARDGRYDVPAIAADLCALAMRFSQGPVRLVGHDWGAIASYAAVAFAPHLFSQLVTVAVPPFRAAGARFARPAQLKRSWYIGLFQLPAVAERKVAADGMALIDRLWRDWSPGFELPPDEMAAVKAAFTAPAHLSAVLGYYRALRSPSALFGEGRKLSMAPIAIPALYVHGVDDGCLGIELTEGVEQAYRAGVRVHRLPSAGHFVHQERPGEFNKVLLDFLQ
jgi:pimeloyl-ACP methyl ester carboxylesterase